MLSTCKNEVESSEYVKKLTGLLSQMLLKVAETNNNLLTFLISCNFFSKNFQMTKFCELAHEEKVWKYVLNMVSLFISFVTSDSQNCENK